MSKTLTKILCPRRVAEGPSRIIRAAGGTGGLPGLGCAGSLPGAFCPGSLVKLPSRERNGAFGLAARAGEGGADQRAGQKAEGSGGLEVLTREHQRGEPSLAGFGGVVFQGEAIPGKAWRRGDAAQLLGRWLFTPHCAVFKMANNRLNGGVSLERAQASQLRSYGDNLRRERMRQQLTQERLAEMVGLHPRTIQKIEAGKVNILITTFVRLQRALRCPWETLLGRP